MGQPFYSIQFRNGEIRMETTEIRYMDAIENHCKVDAILNGTKKV